MIEIEGDNIAFFDVDDTLIIYEYSPDRIAEAVQVGLENSDFLVQVVPHKEHIQTLKMHKTWGNTVVVWSRSGHRWAKTVVKALGLEEYVDLVISKPLYYYDDKNAHEILGERRYKVDRH